MEDNRRKQMQEYTKQAFERGFFHGTYLLAEGGRIICEGAMGTRDAEGKIPLETSTVFELASVSKQFTAAAVMLLRNRGALSLDDPLQKFFPALPYRGRTVKNLLNHTGGLPDYEKWVAELAEKEGNIPGNDVIERFLCENGLPGLFEPGEKWSYSNTGYSLLALLVERVSKKPFAEFMKEELFLPAGMTDTQVYHRRRNGVTIENYAYGLVLEDGKYILPDESREAAFVIPLDGIEGDGVVNTNVHDMLKWDRALREGKIISLATQEEMYAPTILNNGEIEPYGFGWGISQDTSRGRAVGHGGGWPGYNTNFTRFLDRDMVVVLLMNRTGCDSRARSVFMEGLNAIAAGEQPKTPATLEEIIDREADKSRYAALCGKYEDGFSVRTEDGHLYITIVMREENALEVELFPIGENLFGVREMARDIYLDGEVIRAKFETKEREFRRIDL